MNTVALIPCLNEEQNIESVVTGARLYCDVVVVADNGSSDLSRDIAVQAGAIVTTCHKPGLGNNLINGLKFVVSKYNPKVIVLIDGDGQHTPGNIADLLHPVQTGYAKLAIGDRQGQMPKYRAFGNKVLKWLFNVGASQTVNDPMIGLWAIRRDALKIPTNTGWGCYIEMLENVRKNCYQGIMSVPVNVHYHDDYSRNSSKPAIWLGLCLARNIIKYRFLK